MANPKSWVSMQDQLILLKQRGLLIDNEPAALNYLARIGYYRLSGYWYPFREIDKANSAQQKHPIRSSRFIADSHFEDVVKLYVFDKKLRLLALDALERVEMSVRVDVAHLLGQKEPYAHENPACLHGNFAKKVKSTGPRQGHTEHQVWLDRYNAMLQRSRREPFIAHHNKKYGGRVPVWAAIEVWDFGLLSRLFEGMQFHDKNLIAKKYGLDEGATLSKWLRSLNFIRNVSAHHSRLWNINVLESSPLPPRWPDMKNNKPYMYFAMMSHLLAVICPNSTWSQRLIDLLNDCPDSKNGVLTLNDFGVCPGWDAHLLQGQK